MPICVELQLVTKIFVFILFLFVFEIAEISSHHSNIKKNAFNNLLPYLSRKI